jgi:hypothetical protein
MGNMIQCAAHGERQGAFVCSHLAVVTAGLGFNRDEPAADRPFPDAWCDDCELIRSAHGGWNEESEKLLKVSVICSVCYERIRIRNTRTATTLEDLAGLKWKCSSCEEWHTGPCLDFSYHAPFYWTKEHEEASRRETLLPGWGQERRSRTFLNEDYCAINDQDFFVRGIIKVPIIGTAEEFCWGVWGSLSRENFGTLLKRHDDPRRSDIPAMFSWLSSQIPQYPDTLSLKMYTHIQDSNLRPYFELEPTDHPLSEEYHKGITPQRVKELMAECLRETSWGKNEP